MSNTYILVAVQTPWLPNQETLVFLEDDMEVGDIFAIFDPVKWDRIDGNKVLLVSEEELQNTPFWFFSNLVNAYKLQFKSFHQEVLNLREQVNLYEATVAKIATRCVDMEKASDYWYKMYTNS